MTERQLIGNKEWLKFLWKGHITNWLWKDKLSRRVTRNNAFGEYKMSYLNKYAEFARNIKVPPYSSDELHPREDEKIFTLWFQGEENAPDIVKKCFRSIKEKYGDRFVILTDKTLYDYIKLPEFIMQKWQEKKIVAANFSDIVRIELLYTHGGYWFDATDFLTSRIPKIIEDSPFFMYVTSDVFFPHMFVQTCFMRGMKNDPLMGMWRELIHEYWRKEEMACEYFLVHMLLKLLVRENPKAREFFEKMPKLPMDPTHLLWNKIGNLPFNKELYDEMCREVFFQKCSYKPQKRGVKEIIPGSMADYVVNGKVK